MSIRVFLSHGQRLFLDGLHAILKVERSITVVGTSTSGVDTINQIGKLQPDIAAIDYALPEVNGVEATHQLCKLSLPTRFLMMSADSSPEFVYRALKSGAAGYVTTQSRAEDLIDGIRSVHQGKRYLSSQITKSIVDLYIKEDRFPGPLHKLTSRERQILQMVVEGRTSAQVAAVLSLSPKTVETYRSRIMKKLDIENFSGLVRFAIRNGITQST